MVTPEKLQAIADAALCQKRIWELHCDTSPLNPACGLLEEAVAAADEYLSSLLDEYKISRTTPGE